jgi:hypothetical protein
VLFGAYEPSAQDSFTKTQLNMGSSVSQRRKTKKNDHHLRTALLEDTNEYDLVDRHEAFEIEYAGADFECQVDDLKGIIFRGGEDKKTIDVQSWHWLRAAMKANRVSTSIIALLSLIDVVEVPLFHADHTNRWFDFVKHYHDWAVTDKHLSMRAVVRSEDALCDFVVGRDETQPLALCRQSLTRD